VDIPIKQPPLMTLYRHGGTTDQTRRAIVIGAQCDERDACLEEAALHEGKRPENKLRKHFIVFCILGGCPLRLRSVNSSRAVADSEIQEGTPRLIHPLMWCVGSLPGGIKWLSPKMKVACYPVVRALRIRRVHTTKGRQHYPGLFFEILPEF